MLSRARSAARSRRILSGTLSRPTATVIATSNAPPTHARTPPRHAAAAALTTFAPAPAHRKPLHRRTFATEAPATTRNALPSKVLIANRGEIACRVMRTCRRLGIQTVAVYSEADAHAAHAVLADEAYCIGPAPSAESYLCMDRIVEVCLQSGAQAVHPGYGFLSENAEFADKLHAAGITFMGPPASAIVSMGSKSASKEIMTQAGVPCVPGYHGSDQSDATLQREADKIGYPVLIKAVKGGGGKGMKIVQDGREFAEQLQSARREAITSFGDGDVLIERYLTKPRHVEVQIVSSGAPHNEHVAISTRDCSVQRRHQKIIEEAPAPHLSAEVERDLCDKATAAARAVNYEGAGTVEFILDADTGEAWFLECNTRLQVEHPVSEMVSGIDLVEWQLEVAAGNALPLRQEQIGRRGHSFEARIYAEDTRANFLPDVGHLSHVAFPTPTTALLSTSAATDDGVLASVRVDTGVATGDEVSVYYDPMIAKVIVHGRDRQDALRLMRRALQQTHIVGPKTNIDFLTKLCRHPAFIDGSGLETGFIGKFADDLHPPLDIHSPPSKDAAVHAALYLALRSAAAASIASQPATAALTNAWLAHEFTSFRPSTAQQPASSFVLQQRARRGEEQTMGSVRTTVTPVPYAPHRYQVMLDDKSVGLFDARLEIDGLHLVIQPIAAQQATDATAAIEPLGRANVKVIARAAAPSGPPSTATRLDLFVEGSGAHVELDVVAPTWYAEVKGAKSAQKGSVMAPMPSKVVDVRVQVGQRVEEGEVVVVLEAMKTEHTLRAPKAGVVAKITVEKGAMCAEGTELVLFEKEDEEAKE